MRGTRFITEAIQARLNEWQDTWKHNEDDTKLQKLEAPWVEIEADTDKDYVTAGESVYFKVTASRTLLPHEDVRVTVKVQGPQGRVGTSNNAHPTGEWEQIVSLGPSGTGTFPVWAVDNGVDDSRAAVGGNLLVWIKGGDSYRKSSIGQTSAAISIFNPCPAGQTRTEEHVVVRMLRLRHRCLRYL